METNYAGFWSRVGATIIDSIVLFLAGLAIWSVFFRNLFPFFPSDAEIISGQYNPFDSTIIIYNIISIILGWLYYSLQESSSYQATLGKRAVKVRVTDLNNQRISFGRASGRYFGKFLSGLILSIGYLMMLWTKKKQTLHDKMAGTLVLKR